LTLTDAPLEGVLTETDLDPRTHLIRVDGDASLVGRRVRSLTAAAVAAGRLSTIVDLTGATDVASPLAWELSRAHERLLWRGGQVVVIFDSTALESLFDAFGLHRAPDVVRTLDEGLAATNVGEAGKAIAHRFGLELIVASSPGPPVGEAATAGPGSAAAGRATGNGEAVEAPWIGASTAAPPFSWRRNEELPASWSFQLPGGPGAPSVVRAAIGRVLTGRLSDEAHARAVLLASEAVTNSVLHGGADESGAVEVTVTVRGDAVRVEVTDPRGGFRPPPYPDDPLAAGRGLPIIHSLARTWGVDGPPGGHVWFELARTAA
jgi:anti-sigma regulatory factor (Ser/Thr protein kinase)